KKLVWKDIVKIERDHIMWEEFESICIAAPTATINRIVNYEVERKKPARHPSKLVGIIACSNPNCITRAREPVKSHLTKVSQEPLRYRCYYCGRFTDLTQSSSILYDWELDKHTII
ncbi:MAG: aspartate carbamoyltransferase regulatory subunit, partial [Thermoplasmata archaeon]|nr:aspartate carbamoyltransferase regulatory subunit [Thermoplasmata archaeon]